MGAPSRRPSLGSPSPLRPLEAVAAGVLVGVLLAGLVLMVLSPGAWPVPLLAVAGLAGLAAAVATRLRAGVEADRSLDDEVAAGIAEMERWLAQRHHT